MKIIKLVKEKWNKYVVIVGLLRMTLYLLGYFKLLVCEELH